MRVESHEPARFGRESPVLRHWLANSTGFRVEGPGCHGVVERVYGLPGATTSIAVRRPLRRRVLVPADAVVEVVPAEELLIVGVRRRESRPARGRQSRRLARTAGAAGVRGGLAFGGSTARVAAAALRDLAHVARAVARLLVLAALAALRILRDAGLTLAELAEAARPRVRRVLRRAVREAASAVARVREAAERERSRRRRDKLARSLEAMVASLGRDRSSGNGHVSSDRAPERPRVKH